MALTIEDKMTIASEVQDQLSGTPYACTSLAIVNGGTANFLFRGNLARPLPDGEKTVVLKHSRAYVSANRDFALDISRCKHEVTMLDEMASFQVRSEDYTCIRTPRLYRFDDTTTTQIMEDLSNTSPLTDALISKAPFPYGAFACGEALGLWLRRFHSWSADAPQAHLRELVYENVAMRKIRYKISYGAFVDILKKFPEIWRAKGHILEEVERMATAEYARLPHIEPSLSWGIIHGDFWSGNILLPNVTQGTHSKEFIRLHVIDWELAQYGRREYDLGQMIGDFYERKVFDNAANALPLLRGFIKGYGPLTEEEAFRIAIHAGQHLVCWYIRRDPKPPPKELRGKVEEAMRIGSDFIVKAWAKDRTWFAGSDLACLFTDSAGSDLPR